MASNAPIRAKYLEGKVWTAVDNSTGQDISFDCPVRELLFTVFNTSTTNLADTFVITPVSTNRSHTDAVTVTQNPLPIAMAVSPGTTMFNIKAGSATAADVHVLILR